MDVKVEKKKSKIEKSSLESKKRKKEKHKEIKKQHGTDKTFDPNEIVEGDCIGEAGESQACSIDGKFTRNREEDGDTSKRKKKKRGRESEVVSSNIADDTVAEVFNENHKSKMKKRKNRNDSLNEMQEMIGSKPSKKGKVTVDNDFKNNECDPPLVEGYNNANNHSIVAEDGQGKEMKNVLGKKKKKTKAEECKTIDVDDDDQGKKVKKKKLSDKSKNEIESNEGDQHLAKGIEGDDDDQGKKMKKKKLSDKSKIEIESSEGDQHLAKGIEGEDDGQGKKMKKKKPSEKIKSKESNEVDDQEGKKMKKRKPTDKNKSKESAEVDNQGKKMKIKKKTKAGTGESPGGTSKPKRVTFNDKVEVCCDGLIRGKRFTPEEDQMLREAVSEYIESHGLGDDGLDMILHCNSHRDKVKNCWKEIGEALPHRPTNSVYSRAHILFEKNEQRNRWTPEELDFIRKVQKEHGSDWKSVSEALGKNRFHVKDAWRRVKFTELKKGPWTQEEYQELFDLVNMDLRVRSLQDSRKAKHGMLRDNISWEAISSRFKSRSSSHCCKKWYEHLTSPLVAEGVWTDTDDYRMIHALYVLDACCMEEVDWDNLVEDRDGDVCRKRWEQMVRHIGEHGRKSFAEQVEVLAKRFCPDLLEAREAFDSKPVVCT